jgi:hypothetical protein
MGSSIADRRTCRWGFLSLTRRCKNVFQYILIDLICKGEGAGSLVELGANLIHSNMMRWKVATRPVILVYETLLDRTKSFAMR